MNLDELQKEAELWLNHVCGLDESNPNYGLAIWRLARLNFDLKQLGGEPVCLKCPTI